MSFTFLMLSWDMLIRAFLLCGDGSSLPPCFHTHPRMSTCLGKMKVLEAATLMLASMNLLRILMYVSAASSWVSPPMKTSSMIWQHPPSCSSSLMIFFTSRLNSSLMPSSPCALLVMTLSPPKGVITPSHSKLSLLMWFWKKPLNKSRTMMCFHLPITLKMSSVVVIGVGTSLILSLTGPKLMSILTSFLVSSSFGLSFALFFLCKNTGQTDCTVMPSCWGSCSTPCLVMSSITSCNRPLRAWL